MEKLRNFRGHVSGFSILEVLVALGLISVVSIGMAQYMTQMQRAQRLLESKNQVSVFTNSIQNILNIPPICTQAFNPSAQNFNLAQSKGTVGADWGQAIRLRLPGGTTWIESGYREKEFLLRRLYLLSEQASVNMAPPGANPNYLIKVMGDIDILNPSNFQEVLISRRVNFAHMIIETDTANNIMSCRTSVSQMDQNQLFCESVGGTFNAGSCALPAPPPSPSPTIAQQVQTLCAGFGGTYSNGMCSLPEGGSTSTSTTTPSSTTVTPAQLNIICDSMGGTYSGGNCTLPSAPAPSGTATLPPTLRGCQNAPPSCGTCKFASCTPTGWACTWDFRGSCMGYWEDSF